VSTARIVPIAVGLVTFVALLLPWRHLLAVDQCLDAGDEFENGVCTGEGEAVIGFWRWHPGLIAFLLGPPLIGALVMFALARLAFVSKHVPPNTSL
jgi:hypothetical protein